MLYAAEALTGLGDGVFWVGVVAAISVDPSFETLLAVAVLARLVPRALLSVAAGSLVDRGRARSILVGGTACRASVMAALAVAFGTGLPIEVVLLGMLVSYFLGVPWQPALWTSLPGVVGENDLGRVSATICTIRQVMVFAGPLAGVAVARWSIAAAIAVNAAALGTAALCIGMVGEIRHRRRSPRAPSRPRTTNTAALVDGLSTLATLTGLVYFLRGAEMVLHVLVVRDLLGSDATAIGYLGGAVGLGAITVTPLARRIAITDRALVPMIAAVALNAVPTATLAVAGNLATASILLVPVGAGMVLFEVVTVVTVQRASPLSAAGHAFGTINAASNTAKLAGAIVTPILVGLVGVADAIVAVSVIVLVGGFATAVPLRRVSRRAEARRSELAPIVERLGGLGLFEGVSPVGLERLSRHCDEVHLVAGDVLIREGDDPDDLFVIVDGTFEVRADGRTVNDIGPDDWAGEIGLVEDLPRTATVTAVSTAIAWRFPGDLFLCVLAGTDDTSALDSNIARRLDLGRSSAS